MKTRYINLVMILTALVFYSGCSDSDNDPDCSVTWSADLEAEISDLTAAAQAFGMDPSTTTCNSYRLAVQAYLNALEPYGDCAALSGQNRAEWELAVEESQEYIDELDCSSYE